MNFADLLRKHISHCNPVLISKIKANVLPVAYEETTDPPPFYVTLLQDSRPAEDNTLKGALDFPYSEHQRYFSHSLPKPFYREKVWPVLQTSLTGFRSTKGIYH